MFGELLKSVLGAASGGGVKPIEVGKLPESEGDNTTLLIAGAVAVVLIIAIVLLVKLK